MLQITKMRKYKNNYGKTYGRITLSEKIVRQFFNQPNIDVIDVLVKLNPETGELIISKVDSEIIDEIEETEE